MTASAAFVAHQLERLRSFWPNLPVSQVALDEWCDVFGPFAENEISAGVRHIIHTYSEMAAPKPSHLIAAIRHVRGDKMQTFSEPNPNQPLCVKCGTMRTLWDEGVESARNGPAHLESCPFYESPIGTTRDDLARFRTERGPAPPTRGLAKIGEILPK
jgi:hypothetical protein